MQEIKVRSRRTESRFYIDNEFLNGYAAKVGWKGHIVYSALCRHEKNGIAFPGLRHLARELGVSVSTAQRGIKELVKWNIIQIEKPNKKNLPFTYWLIDYSDWKEIENKTDWYNQSRVLSQKQGVSPQRHPCITTETPRVSPQRQNNTNTNNTNNNTKEEEKEISSFKKKEGRKPFYEGQEMRFVKGKWFVIPRDGSHPWLEFAGSKSEIKYK